jgi:hypothetical protein
MDAQRKRWEQALQTDPGLQERLRLLDVAGNPATKKGDLLCLAVKNEIPFVVSWDGATIHVERREAKNPFCLWHMEREQFNRFFLEELPPILVAMNNDQENIKMKSEHHNGSLVISFMVMLQECGKGR